MDDILLFMSKFIACVQLSRGNMSTIYQHLVIMDSDNSHVTVEVELQACHVGLDLITLPSHTSHALQQMNVVLFNPFKLEFRTSKDIWSLANKVKGAKKEDLAKWVSGRLKKTLTHNNITKPFKSSKI